MSRYYSPYFNPRAASGGMAAFMYRPEEQAAMSQTGPYYYPDRRRQTTVDTYVPSQQNEVIPSQQSEVYPPQQSEYYPQQPEISPVSPTEATEIAYPTEKTEVFSTTLKTVLPELVEPDSEAEEVEEPAPKPKKAVSKKKQVKKPVFDEDDEEDSYAPKIPASAFFPMLFYGGRSAGGSGGPTAIANAYSTGRGGVATSHATAYGSPRPEQERYKNH